MKVANPSDKILPLRSPLSEKSYLTGPDPDWMSRTVVGDSGKPLNNLSNVLFALRAAPQLHGAIGFDEMSGQIIVLRPLPAMGPVLPANRPIDDAHVVCITEWLQSKGLGGTTVKTVNEAVLLVARENSFHPVKRYLTGLTWDRRQRVGRWLHEYLGAKDTPYNRAVGRFWMVSAIARIMEPGCKADHMLVLEGPQGARKSTAVSILGGEWFSDHLPDDLKGKDASIALRGNWIIEIAEMHAMTKADASALKAWITRRTEKYRPPFARYSVEEPRQSVLIGTINPTANGYLQDPTGARRFWPVQVGLIGIEHLKADRDQIWAEAYYLYQNGVEWWPDAMFEKNIVAPEQSDRQETDPWAEPILQYLVGVTETTLMPIAINALNLDFARIDRGTQIRIVDVLTRDGWKRGKKDPSSRRQTYVRSIPKDVPNDSLRSN